MGDNTREHLREVFVYSLIILFKVCYLGIYFLIVSNK